MLTNSLSIRYLVSGPGVGKLIAQRFWGGSDGRPRNAVSPDNGRSSEIVTKPCSASFCAYRFELCSTSRGDLGHAGSGHVLHGTVRAVHLLAAVPGDRDSGECGDPVHRPARDGRCRLRGHGRDRAIPESRRLHRSHDHSDRNGGRRLGAHRGGRLPGRDRRSLASGASWAPPGPWVGGAGWHGRCLKRPKQGAG